MNTDHIPYSSFAPNPFAALMNPELLAAAHDRMAIRAPGVVYRPLDKSRLVKSVDASLAAADADIDDELEVADASMSAGFGDVDEAANCPFGPDFDRNADIIIGSFGDLVQTGSAKSVR